MPVIFQISKDYDSLDVEESEKSSVIGLSSAVCPQAAAVLLAILLIAILGLSIAALAGGASSNFTHYDNYKEEPRTRPFELK
jgi:hypothetical protein